MCQWSGIRLLSVRLLHVFGVRDGAMSVCIPFVRLGYSSSENSRQNILDSTITNTNQTVLLLHIEHAGCRDYSGSRPGILYCKRIYVVSL